MSGRSRRAPAIRCLVLAAVLALLGACNAAPSTRTGPSPSTAAGTTVVSLTFDDGQATQYATLAMLSSRRMVGTYYINSAMVDSSNYYMSWSQISELAAAGNEIGGHTLHHANLSTVDATRAKSEICDDRTNLLNRGFRPVTSFAYPEAASTPAVEQIVRDCGYTNARAAGDVACGGCPYAETVPPPDRYYLRTPPGITTSTTVADLKGYVTNAETHGGGWVILAFHGICDNRCTEDNSISPEIFTPFLDWLADRVAHGVVVRTVGEEMKVAGGGT